MITLKDFKEEQAPWRYYSMVKEQFELTMEPCMSGYDVALYNKHTQNLIQPKVCTSLNHINKFEDHVEAMQRAISYANDLWSNRYEKE